MAKKQLFKARFVNRPADFKGEINTRKSMTVPGQGLSPADIVRGFGSAEIQKQYFTDQPLSQFQNMDITDRIDYLNDLATRNDAAKYAIMDKVGKLKSQFRIKKQQEYRDQVKADLQLQQQQQKPTA